jgi:hypothetical protein
MVAPSSNRACAQPRAPLHRVPHFPGRPSACARPLSGQSERSPIEPASDLPAGAPHKADESHEAARRPSQFSNDQTATDGCCSSTTSLAL